MTTKSNIIRVFCNRQNSKVFKFALNFPKTTKTEKRRHPVHYMCYKICENMFTPSGKSHWKITEKVHKQRYLAFKSKEFSQIRSRANRSYKFTAIVKLFLYFSM